MVKFVGTSAIQAHPVSEFGAIIDGAAIANILNGGTESMVKFFGTSSLQFHPVDEQGNIIDATAIANEISVALPGTGQTLQDIPLSIFIETTGNDITGDGTAGLPYATINRAAEDVNNLIIDSTSVTIEVGDGTFDLTSIIFNNGSLGFSNVIINGNGIANTIINLGGSIQLIADSNPRKRYQIQNCRIQSGSGALVTNNIRLTLDTVEISLFFGLVCGNSIIFLDDITLDMPLTPANNFISASRCFVNLIGNFIDNVATDYSINSFAFLSGNDRTTFEFRNTYSKIGNASLGVRYLLNNYSQVITSGSLIESDIPGNLTGTTDNTSAFLGKLGLINGSFGSDSAAGIAGLVAGDFYQTDGTGTGVFADVGVVMVKQ